MRKQIMSEEVISLSPNDLDKINRAIREVSEEKTKIEIMNESIKDLKKSMVDDLKESGLTSSRLNSMIKIYHANSKQEYFDEQSDLEALYENVFPIKG